MGCHQADHQIPSIEGSRSVPDASSGPQSQGLLTIGPAYQDVGWQSGGNQPAYQDVAPRAHRRHVVAHAAPPHSVASKGRAAAAGRRAAAAACACRGDGVGNGERLLRRSERPESAVRSNQKQSEAIGSNLEAISHLLRRSERLEIARPQLGQRRLCAAPASAAEGGEMGCSEGSEHGGDPQSSSVVINGHQSS